MFEGPLRLASITSARLGAFGEKPPRAGSRSEGEQEGRQRPVRARGRALPQAREGVLPGRAHAVWRGGVIMDLSRPPARALRPRQPPRLRTCHAGGARDARGRCRPCRERRPLLPGADYVAVWEGSYVHDLCECGNRQDSTFFSGSG